MKATLKYLARPSSRSVILLKRTWVSLLPTLLLLSCFLGEAIEESNAEVLARISQATPSTASSTASASTASARRTQLVIPDAMRTKTVAQLLVDLASGDAALRSTAAFYLGDLGSKAAKAVPALVEVVKRDNSKWARRSAAKALGRIGTSEAIAGLRIAAVDRDPWVVHSANKALSSVAPQARFRIASYDASKNRATSTLFIKGVGNKVTVTARAPHL
jgi:HEAT repeat protein